MANTGPYNHSLSNMDDNKLKAEDAATGGSAKTFEQASALGYVFAAGSASDPDKQIDVAAGARAFMATDSSETLYKEVDLTPITPPAKPGAITGDLETEILSGSLYEIAPVTGATEYEWQIDQGIGGDYSYVTNDNDTYIEVDFELGDPTLYGIRVRAKNSKGSSVWSDEVTIAPTE